MLGCLLTIAQDKYAEARWNFLGLQETGLYVRPPPARAGWPCLANEVNIINLHMIEGSLTIATT